MFDEQLRLDLEQTVHIAPHTRTRSDELIVN